MGAPGAAAGTGGDAAQGQTAGADGEAQAQTGPDLSAITGQLEQLATGQQELQSFLQSTPWAPEAETPPAEPELPFDPALLDPGDPDFDPQRVQEMITDAARREAQQIIEQQLAPVREELADERRTREAADLIGEIPEMADREVQQQVIQTAAELIEANGWPQDLINDPKFWRIAYLTGKAAEIANTEGADAPAAAHLEGGGGAAPTPAQQAEALGDLITGPSKGGRSSLPF